MQQRLTFALLFYFFLERPFKLGGFRLTVWTLTVWTIAARATTKMLPLAFEATGSAIGALIAVVTTALFPRAVFLATVF